MKKNILGAIVIFFVAIALILIIDDISKSKNPQHQLQDVEAFDNNQQPNIATTDIEEN